MKHGTKSKGDMLIFTGFLFVSGDGARRLTTLNKPDGKPGERRVQLNVNVPKSAFRDPEFTVEVNFNEPEDDSGKRAAAVTMDVMNAMTELPVSVKVIHIDDVKETDG